MTTDFDAILDQCLTDLAAGHATIETCLTRYPAQAGQLRPLLLVAEQVRTAPARPALPRPHALLNLLLSSTPGATGSS